MKNIFEVDSNEIKRILSLHEESTKKQYLNVLNEQIFSSPNDVVTKVVKDLKTSAKNNSKPVQDPEALSSYTTSQVNCISEGRCVPSKTKFVSFKNRNDIAVAYNVKLNKQDSPVNVVYYCRQKSFDMRFPKGKIVGTNETLGNVLREKVCNITGKTRKLNNDNPSTQTKENDYVKQLDTVNVIGKRKKSVKPQVFATQNTELTKQIQTSLGNTTPTGQITDTELDQLLTQLKS